MARPPRRGSRRGKSRRTPARSRCRIDRLEAAFEIASAAEWKAFQALRDYRQASMAEVAEKARYLIQTIDVDNEREHVADNAVELLVTCSLTRSARRRRAAGRIIQ